MKLADVARGKDNNFNLIRITAAFAVLFGHSFVLAKGPEGIEPLYTRLGISLGTIAVDAFFVVSGFLVTASLLSRKSTLEFACARVLRIYPALVVMVLLTIFGLGLFFTAIPALAFLRSHETHVFALRNMTLIRDAPAFTLPGVFEANPYPRSVNGSLWSMPIEIRMYAVLAIMWMALRLIGRLRVKAVAVSVVLLWVLSLAIHFEMHFRTHAEQPFWELLFMFFTGATYYVLREYIPLSRTLFLAGVAALAASSFNLETFFAVYNLVLAYVIFWLAYVPAGAIRNYNRLGDYSYGVYIYAFPIQQSFAALIPGISVGAMVLASSVTTLFFAALSWHLIEERALRLKGGSVKVSRRMIDLCRARPSVPAPSESAGR